jgi:hypothetical protein
MNNLSNKNVSKKMRSGATRLALYALLFLSVASGWCQTQVDFTALHAGQYNIGLTGVLNFSLTAPRNAYLNGYTSMGGVPYGPGGAAADAYLRDRPVPVVLWTDGYHLIDGHHRTFGAFLLSEDVSLPDFPDHVYVTQVADFSSITDPAAFWAAMETGDGTSPYVWGNNRGVTMDLLTQPPGFIPSLTDDELRTIAADVQTAGGYAGIPGFNYQEFYWADYFRDKLFLIGSESAGGNPGAPFQSADRAAIIQEGVRLAHLPGASGLPGFVAVPEPAVYGVLVGMGLVLLVVQRRMRRQSAPAGV